MSGDKRSRSIVEACEVLKAADPDARLVVFREDEPPKYRLCGPSPDRFCCAECGYAKMADVKAAEQVRRRPVTRLEASGYHVPLAPAS